ncbi:hypothetical protein OSB04_007939 [Centaurea solstitialis]|uniref:Arf-GAP domain-containing protein n=1 Tax=Centaurea solstitialis TaxID=347529 RepID=A0AA38TMI9_9ASTR|nr:hypothetical protein OSB04_007939 [Centaurea solstitialis]
MPPVTKEFVNSLNVVLLKHPENRATVLIAKPNVAIKKVSIISRVHFALPRANSAWDSLETRVSSFIISWSQVRSATLDTWLPEQVAFIQSMGNEKSNSYWEAELPPNYDRVGIENFIRAKYEDKRWVAKDGRPISPPAVQEEKAVQWQRPVEKTGGTSYSESPAGEKKSYQAHTTKSSTPAARINLRVPPKGPEPVILKAEPAVPSAELAKEVAETPPKVDFATDLFDMLSMDDGPTEKAPEAASTDDNLWAGFQSAVEVSSTGQTDLPKAVDNKAKPASGLEDLFKDSPPLSQPNASEKPQKDVKNDIMSLFEKGNNTSPYALHQQQLAMLAQQQYLLMAAAAKSGGLPKFAGNGQQQQVSGGTNLPNQNWANVGYQFPGMQAPAPGKDELEKYLQQMGNMGAANPAGNSFQAPTSSIYGMGVNPSTNGTTLPAASIPGFMGQNSSFNNMGPSGAAKPQAASPLPSAPTSKSAKDYDFSSLTQGMFSKP